MPMKPALRHIAVTVVEKSKEKFGWQLLEQDQEGQWQVLEEGATLARYAPAMSAGLERLQSLVDDLAVGPRHLSPRSRKASKVEVAEVSDPVGGDEPRAPGSLFGFGPLK